ncbi:MAG TPA: FkbM family methyltransferase [Pyrinomonadaceae bacterium]|nr:FkbM family methyltransferase [Pyrinomonadaceae bacterium]
MNALKQLAYKAIDAATLGRGIERNFHGNPVRFPPRWSRYFKTDYEPETFAFLRDNLTLGETFLDIGAHIGLFSVVAAKKVGETGRVIAFEPTPSTRDVMKQVLHVNGFEDFVEVRSEAVARERATTMFYDSGDEIPVVNSLVRGENTRNEFEVQVVSLDEFVTEHDVKPDCIKVDVEGSELDLLIGAEKTLAEFRPQILLSVHPPFIPNAPKAIEEIWDLLERHGYRVSFEGKPADREWFVSKSELFDVILTNSE